MSVYSRSRKLIQNADKRFPWLIQFIKFGIVGATNTAISYGTEMLLYYVVFKSVTFAALSDVLHGIGIDAVPETVKIIVISLIAFLVSVTNSYVWNSIFVFKAEKKTFPQHLWTYFKTILCYGATGMIMAPIIKIQLTDHGVQYWLASIIVLVITVPLNFILNKVFAFGKRTKTTSSEKRKKYDQTT